MSDKLKSVRANWMLLATFAGVFACFGMYAWGSFASDSTLAGALLMAAGKFLGNWETAFNWEFGTSKGSQLNQEALRTVATTQPAPGTVTVTPPSAPTP